MKVAIDIRRVRDFGVGTYTRNLIATLARLDRETHYTLVGTGDDWSHLDRLPENFSFLEAEPGRALRLAWKLRRQKTQLCHTPYLSTSWVLPCPHVVTVHDTAEFLDLSGDGGTLADLIRFQRTRLALRRARRILSVSQATGRDLQRLFGIPRDKIEVIYNALDPRLAHTPPPADQERTLSRYNVNSPYLLYAGNVKPHKNLPRLIEAFALVKDELRAHPRYADLKLLIIGDELSQHPQLRRTVIQSRTQQDVRFLGFVDAPTLSIFYARAAAFVFPSLHEGFGLPPLEAMAHGTPVVSSNASALPEVLGEAALYVNPENVFDISRGIRQLLLDDKLRRWLAEQGRAQVAKFSWEKSVERVLAVYGETANRARASW